MEDESGQIIVTYSQLMGMIDDMLQSLRVNDDPGHHESATMRRAIGYVFGYYMSARYKEAFRWLGTLSSTANPGQAAIDLKAHMRGVTNG